MGKNFKGEKEPAGNGIERVIRTKQTGTNRIPHQREKGIRRGEPRPAKAGKRANATAGNGPHGCEEGKTGTKAKESTTDLATHVGAGV